MRQGLSRVLGASSLIVPLLHPYIHSNDYWSGYKGDINLEYKKSPQKQAKQISG